MSDIQTDWQAFLASPHETTFIPIYEHTKGLVWTLCRRILGNDEDALDAFQSAYARLVAGVEQGGMPKGASGGDDASQLIYRLAIREAQNLQRRRARHAAREEAMEHLEAIPSGGSAATDIAAQRQLREQLESLVALLPEPLRLPVQLHYFHGLSQVEIGRLLNITQGHTSRRIAKGLRTLEPLARRAGLAEALPSLAIVAAAGAMLEAPEALSAGAVYAQAQAVLAAGGAAAVSGGLGALAGKLLVGTVVLKKAAILTGAAILTVGFLMAGKHLMASANDGKAATKDGTKLTALAPTPAPGAMPQVMTKNLPARATPGQKPIAPGGASAGASPLARPSQAGSPPFPAQRPERMVPITGRIVNAENGKPIAGAEISLIGGKKSRTDTRGVYHFDSIPAGTITASVAAEGYVDRSDMLNFGNSGTNAADFTLDPAVTVAFQVRDERGAPVPNAQVTFRTVEDTNAPNRQGVSRIPVRSDARGVVAAKKISRIHPLEITAIRFGFRMHGQSTTATVPQLTPTMMLPWAKPITLQPAKLGTTVTLTMDRIRDLDRAVQGQVVDETGKPIPLVEVSRMAYPEVDRMGNPSPILKSSSSRTLTDENGRYQLAFQSETPLSYFCALADGWAPSMRENLRTGTPGHPTEVNFTLRRGHTLRGVVVDEAGKPVAGAQLAAAPTRDQITANYRPIVREAVTRADGTFMLTGLSSPTVALQVSGPPIRGTTPLTKQVRASLMANLRPPRLIEQQDVDCSITLKLQSPLVIRGRVLDRETGQPVPSFRISGESQVPRNGNQRGSIYLLRGQSVMAGDGRFELQEPMLDRESVCRLVIKGEGYMIAEALDIKAEPAATATEHVIRITRGRPLRGVVLDAATKAPLKDAMVYFASGGENYSGDQSLLSNRQSQKRNQVTASTGADGRFSFTEDVPGLLFIVARGYRHALVRQAERARYSVGQGELWIQLTRGEQVSGVCLENGRPAPTGIRVFMELQGEPVMHNDYPFSDTSFSGLTDAAGKFTIDSLRPGTYLMYQRWLPDQNSKLGAYAYRRVTIKAGEHKNTDIGDDRGTLNFKGRLLDAQGKPADSVKLRLKPAFPWSYDKFEILVIDGTPYRSRFHFANLKPGKYNVEVVREKDDFTEEITPLPPITLTGDTEQELRLPRK